jgi:hypothetical protein
MAIQVSNSEVPDGCGYYGEFGAVIGDAELVFIEGRAGEFLASASEFERVTVDGLPCIRPKASLILQIGGLPESEAERLSKELGVSERCASDVIYLRTRSRWSHWLEAELIHAHASGEDVDVNSFGVTRETQARLYWTASSEAQSAKDE